MGRKRHSPEEIIGKLREAEVLIARGQTTPQAAKAIGVTEQTYYIYGRLSRCKGDVGLAA